MRITHKKALLLSMHILLWLGLLSPPIGAQPVDSTQSLIAEKIELVGNSKTRRAVILRYLTFRVGEPINAEVIEESYQRLSQTNFFKEVTFYTRPGSEKGQVVVVIEVKERRGPYFQLEGGHSDLNGWYFVPASLRFDNLFGRGNYFGLRLFLGDRISKISVRYRNPNLFDQNAVLDVELFGGGQEFIHYFGSARASQNVEFGGLRFRVAGSQGLAKYLFFAYRAETYEPKPTARLTDTDSTLTVLPADIADDLEKTKVGAFSVGLYADFRDNPTYPLKGFWGALSGELAHPEVGSEIRFYKITLDGRFFQRIFGRQVFAFHVKAAYTNRDAPFYERFYLGGANSLRGYPDRRLTPVGWGSKLILTNTEFRFPLSSRNFPNHSASGILFFDAGGIWQAGQTPRLEDLYASLGFGFRIKLPVVGTTRFDFSFPLNKVDQNDFQFHISLGQTF
jgi:outer membrane protein insertion porin family